MEKEGPELNEWVPVGVVTKEGREGKYYLICHREVVSIGPDGTEGVSVEVGRIVRNGGRYWFMEMGNYFGEVDEIHTLAVAAKNLRGPKAGLMTIRPRCSLEGGVVEEVSKRAGLNAQTQWRLDEWDETVAEFTV
ncbi:hypothetical protein DRH14_00475 [Candidatus Shapirobacteria bacterium]|nr:MAG: hypothetical protein DRH14_00475 [Candidatus Shapirobacteria bacterium]